MEQRTKQLVDGVWLYAPASYWKLTPAAKSEICGGCGPGKGLLAWLIPDSFLGMSILAACEIHDYEYHIGETDEDKSEADIGFRANLARINQARTKSWATRVVRRILANIYFSFVVDMGASSFGGRKKNG